MPYSIGGQSSGDFKESSGRVQLFHVVTRNSVGLLTPDSFTQVNPPVVTTAKSSTLTSVTKVGVLGSTIAFTRKDYGNGYQGGPIKIGSNYDASVVPLGIYLNDALGNAYENTPGVASGRGPYVCGSGSVVGLSLYETKQQSALGGGSVGDALTAYNVGDKIYASVNGLATNRANDAYEAQAPVSATPTLIGIVKVAPDATGTLLVIDLRI
jgi:hypothetical protein